MAVAAALIIIGLILGTAGIIVCCIAYENTTKLPEMLIGLGLCLASIVLVLVGANRMDTLEATSNENCAECIEEEK